MRLERDRDVSDLSQMEVDPLSSSPGFIFLAAPAREWIKTLFKGSERRRNSAFYRVGNVFVFASNGSRLV